MFTTEEEKPYKEILYLLLEKVHATKAAFYLSESNGSFRLVTQYGFGRTDRLSERILRTDPIAVDIYEHREPHYVNDVRQAGKLAGLMESSSSTRILTAPLYLDRRIVGILDARDKAGREAFTGEDLSWVSDILRRLAQRVRTIPRFASAVVAGAEEENAIEPTAHRGEGPDAFAESGTAEAGSRLEHHDFEPTRIVESRSSPSGLGRPQTVNPEAELSIAHLPTGTARAMQLVKETLESGGERPAGGTGAAAREAGFYKLYLETCLHLPGVELAAISTFEARRAVLTVATRRPLGDEVIPALVENLEKVFARAGAAFPMPVARSVETTEVRAPLLPPLGRDGIAAIQSSVLHAAPDVVSVLSLLLGHGPEEGHEGLRNVHLLVKNSLGEIRASARYRDAYRVLVNKLLEPGLKKYTALKTHSFNVGRMARKLAGTIGLAAVEVEQITVAGILHDVGMKDLNYDELYAKRTLSEQEVALIREHPRVGAFLVDEIPWPYPVVPLIRHHHERWDGAGYPDGLRAEQIPLGARIIHLCEAFDAMTSRTSYRAVLSVPQALDILVSKGGTQFDPELAPAFRRMIEGMKPRP